MTATGLVASAPQILVSNVVQMVNEGDRPFNMEYTPGTRLILAPAGDPAGKDRLFVNEEVAWYFLGKWWADNTNPRARMRADDYNRLRVLYGAYEDEVIWEANRPRLAAFDATGKRITTIVDDPEGKTGNPQTQLGREMSMEQQLSILQDTVLALHAQINDRDTALANSDQAEVPTDATRAPAPPIPGAPVVGQIGTVSLPVAPTPFLAPGEIDPEPDAGARLPVHAAVVHDPNEEEVTEDAPQVIPVGPSRTGGRIQS